MGEVALKSQTVAQAILLAASRRPLITLCAACLLIWLPGLFLLPPLDRDESRFAQASKQMVETRDFVDIRYGKVPRYKKPVGIYWLQSASTLALSHSPYNAIWSYRIPSLIGALIAVMLAYWCTRALAPPSASLIAALFIGFTVSLSAEADIAKTDAVLLASTLGCQAVLLRVYLSGRMPDRALPSRMVLLAGWVSLAIGILVKGPVILAVVGATIVSVSFWDRDWKWLRSLDTLLGIPLALAIVLPWGIAIALQSHGQFYEQSLGGDFASKIMNSQEAHGAPPGYYLALATLTLFPATIMALPGIAAAVIGRTAAPMRFLLAWAGASWLIFEAVPTKLPNYILPAYPAIVIMGALWLMNVEQPPHRWVERLRLAACAQVAVVVIALFAAFAIIPGRFGDGLNAALLAGGAVGLVLGLIAALMLGLRRRLLAALIALPSAAAFYLTAMFGLVPHIQQIWISPRAYAIASQRVLPGDPPVVLAGYVEPSLVFLLGTRTLILNGSMAAEVAAQQGGLAIIGEHERKPFLVKLGELGAIPRVVDELSGFNYSHGRPDHLTFYRVTPAPSDIAPPPE